MRSTLRSHNTFHITRQIPVSVVYARYKFFESDSLADGSINPHAHIFTCVYLW